MQKCVDLIDAWRKCRNVWFPTWWLTASVPGTQHPLLASTGTACTWQILLHIKIDRSILSKKEGWGKERAEWESSY